MNENRTELLDYERTEPKALKPRGYALAALTGAGVGALVTWLVVWILSLDGPMGPLVVLLAPISVVLELGVLSGCPLAEFLLVWIGGPLLYGIYATLLRLRRKMPFVMAAAGFHCCCMFLALVLKKVPF